MTHANELYQLICSCIAEARRQGWAGSPSTYDLTPADCDWIVDQFVAQIGRKPTREEWRGAGYAWVGNPSHVEDEPNT